MIPIAGALSFIRVPIKSERSTSWKAHNLTMANGAWSCIIPPSMPKFFIKTYGCQMNERDSEQVAHSLIARGYKRVANETEADVVLLNTCSVRDMADQKALGKMGMLGHIAKERPEVVFGFLGCMAQARGASLLKNLSHVDLVMGTQKFHRVADYVEELVAIKNGRLRENIQHLKSHTKIRT